MQQIENMGDTHIRISQMRQKSSQKYRCYPLYQTSVYQGGKEIDKIISENQIILDFGHMDLTSDVENERAGAHGMTTVQVLEAAIIKQIEGFSHKVLAFHIMDSRTYRHFCRVGIADKGCRSSTLCRNI